MPRWFDGTLSRVEQITPTVRRFFIKHPDSVALDFRPGQFVTFDFPMGEKRHERWRSYSIASAPNADSDEFELCIGRYPSGRASTYLFEQLNIGDSLRYKGPDGAFVLPDKPAKHIVLICTGTGVAPFRSMIRQIFAADDNQTSVHLIFGTRTVADILYRDEFEQLAAEQPNFRYDVALSRQSDWGGHRGYVHQVYEKHYGKHQEGVHFYLCGWKNMIDEAAEKLQLLGYSPRQISFELYG